MHLVAIHEVPSGYKNLYICYLQDNEIPLCVARDQLTLHFAMYENFNALQITNVQVFVTTLYIHTIFMILDPFTSLHYIQTTSACWPNWRKRPLSNILRDKSNAAYSERSDIG